MTVFVVRSENVEDDTIYGVFSSREKVMEWAGAHSLLLADENVTEADKEYFVSEEYEVDAMPGDKSKPVEEKKA